MSSNYSKRKCRFINDEDWGMRPWAGKHFDPELGDIGPKTHARVFELLLRLKANCLWPAMHECTQAFNLYPQNKLLADDYAIVMGSSHAEPMLGNDITEWDSKARGPGTTGRTARARAAIGTSGRWRTAISRTFKKSPCAAYTTAPCPAAAPWRRRSS